MLATLVVVLPLGGAPPAAGAELDPRPRLEAESDAGEHWDLIARTDSGHTVTARFLISHLGPGRNHGAALGHVIAPDGRVHEFRNARKDGQFLRRDGEFLDVGSSHLDLAHRGADLPHAGGADLPLDSPPAGGFQLDVQKDELGIHLTFPAWRGLALPDAPGVAGPGDRCDLLAVGAPARARIRLGPVGAPELESGASVFLSHSWTSGPELALRRWRLHAVATSGDDAAWWIVTRVPDDAPGTLRVLSALWVGTGVPEVTIVPGTGLGDWRAARSGYRLPRRIEAAGDSWRGQLVLGATFLEHDPLSILPQPFRFLAGLSSKPHRSWLDARLTVQSGSKPFETEAIAAVTFLDSGD